MQLGFWKQQVARRTGVVLAALLVISTAAFAARDDKKTRLTVQESIEIPNATLEPGEYVVELVDSQSSNHIVQFSNADGTEVIATVLAIPNERTDPTGNSKFTFYETPAGDPPALRAWFYPGDLMGQQFAYPEDHASKIAAYSRRHVPSVPQETASAQKTGKDDPVVLLKQVKVVALSPDQEETDLKTAAKFNKEADRKTWDSSSYVTAREEEESRVARQIRKELVTLPYYGVFDTFSYRVNGESVELMGKVTRPTLKSSAERVVKNVEGVEKVANNIEVLPVSPNDNSIRLAVYRSIYSHPMLDRYQLRAVPPIHIIVEDGNVTLEGVVANQADKNVAGIQANSVSGVFSVENNLRVES